MHSIRVNMSPTRAGAGDGGSHYLERDSSDIIKSYLSLNELEEEEEEEEYSADFVASKSNDGYSSSRTASTADDSYANSPSGNLQRLVSQFETYRVNEDGSMLNTSGIHTANPSTATSSFPAPAVNSDTSYNKAKLSLQKMSSKLAGKK